MDLVTLRRSAHAPPRDLRRFLPTTREEMEARGWDAIDILIVNGDAYVDHPAFGGALIGTTGIRYDVLMGSAWVINLVVAEWAIRRPARLAQARARSRAAAVAQP